MIQDRDEQIWTLAYKLAQSGDYIGWWGIEVELRASGFPRARQLLDDEQIRERLDRMCAKAQKDAADA